MLFLIEMKQTPPKILFSNEITKWFNRNYPQKKRGDTSTAAKQLGISQGQFSNILAGRRYLNENERLRISEIIGVNYVDIIGKKPSDSDQSQNTTNIIERTHIELIPGFKNKQMALEINRKLQKIEQLDPDKLKYINHTCDEWLREIEYKKKQKEKETKPGEPAGGASSGYPRK